MIVSKIIKGIIEHREHKNTERELYSMSDRELKDMGISRCDIPKVVRSSKKNIKQ